MKPQTSAALRPRAAAQYVGFGLSTLWKRAKDDPTFPQPRKLSPRITAWMRDDLDAFLARQAGADNQVRGAQ
ncbi:MAG: hypothetical protein CML18_14780 [Pusillimonas sp.]|jgi:prophage regulatory protein|nr:hypothetical protein [Pusillimonas sp.]